MGNFANVGPVSTDSSSQDSHARIDEQPDGTTPNGRLQPVRPICDRNGGRSMKAGKANERPVRRAAYIIARYTASEGTFRDVIKNIGAGGLFVRTSRKIAAGQAIVLEFPLFDFDTPIQVSGRVTRCDKHGFAVVFDKPLEELTGNAGEVPRIVHEGDR